MNLWTVITAVWLAEWVVWSAAVVHCVFSIWDDIVQHDVWRFVGLLLGVVLLVFAMLTAWPLCAVVVVLDALAEQEDGPDSSEKEEAK